MTFEELKTRAENFYLDKENKIKIPYSHYDFDRVVEPPHLMSTELSSNNFSADNKVYFENTSARLELTTERRDKDLEKRVEDEILFDIFWDKEATYISDERIWNISYFLEI